ncbi:hypothetical protein CB1_002237011 [Camelus ferus]|nr:hypothetical protein CB1_002237011 [Camelus ferus]
MRVLVLNSLQSGCSDLSLHVYKINDDDLTTPPKGSFWVQWVGKLDILVQNSTVNLTRHVCCHSYLCADLTKGDGMCCNPLIYNGHPTQRQPPRRRGCPKVQWGTMLLGTTCCWNGTQHVAHWVS